MFGWCSGSCGTLPAITSHILIADHLEGMEGKGRLVGLTKEEVLREIELWAEERAKEREGVDDGKDSS